MSANSKIEWTDHTFNPWEGCQKVGPGCDHCYAETRNARFGGGVAVNWGPGAPRRRTSVSNWHKPIAWNAAHEQFFAEHGRRQRVFCASLADVFDNAVNPAWRADLFALIEKTPNLDWLLLTKRIGNVLDMVPLPWISKPFQHGPDPKNIYPAGWPTNVWLGATICNQAEADRDVPKLLAVPARVRFLSMEPLLEQVDLTPMFEHRADVWNDTGIHWVIAGGESGRDARPVHPAAPRGLRDQCAAAGVPFLWKQWGEWTPGENVSGDKGTVDTAHWFADEWRFGRENLVSFGGHVDDEPDLYRVGKKAAGRLLDGRVHDGYPEAL